MAAPQVAFYCVSHSRYFLGAVGMLYSLDESSLRCAYEDGLEPYVIHHFTAKPWLERTFDGVYSRLLRRLLRGADLAVRVPKSWVPLRLRTGPFAYASRKLIYGREQFRMRVGEPLAARTESLRRSTKESSSL